jgi:hypothetical protein
VHFLYNITVQRTFEKEVSKVLHVVLVDLAQLLADLSVALGGNDKDTLRVGLKKIRDGERPKGASRVADDNGHGVL